MDERYSLFLEMYEIAKTMRNGFGDPLSILSHKYNGRDADLQDFEDIIFDKGLAERANYPHGMRITDNGLNIKPHELRRLYLGLTPESEISNEELYREILIWMTNNGNSHIGPILNDIGINPNKERAIENIMTSEGWIRGNKTNCFLLPAGEAFLFGLERPANQQKPSVTNNTFKISGEGNTVVQDSLFRESPIIHKVNTTPSTKQAAPNIKSWYETPLFKYIIWPVVAGLLIWFLTTYKSDSNNSTQKEGIKKTTK